MAARNGKLYISHTVADTPLLTPLLARLDEKHVDYWVKISPEDSDTRLSAETLQQIADRDVLLRLYTPTAASSGRMQREVDAMRASRQQDGAHGTPERHILVDLVTDPAATPAPADAGYLTVNAATTPMDDWLVVLYNEMGEMQASPMMERRAVLAWVTVGIALLLLVTLFVFVLLIKGL